MNSLLAKLEPAPVWRLFDAICAIPHPSGHETRLAAALAALAEELRDYAAARQAAEAVRQRAARFETVRASGEVGAAAGGQGGVRTSVSAQMQVTGLAGAQTAWSMAEISRFFERDARRYGG